MLAQRFAKAHGTVVITWDLDSNSKQVAALRTSDLKEKVFTSDSGLMGIFVQGAPAYLVENTNSDLKLANGTRVTLHSLALTGHEAETRDLMHQIANAAPGERIHLPNPPAYINVKVSPA